MENDFDKFLDFFKQPIVIPIKQNLLGALGLNSDENKNSDMIAWLLSTNGPFEENIFLKNLLSKININAVEERPNIVFREKTKGWDRPDIIIEWRDYKLIIENKIKSSEGLDQCKGYLDTFKIESSNQGKLIFLTPVGIWPKSIVDKSDERVYNLSYADLADILEESKKDLTKLSQRYRDIVVEYINVLQQIGGMIMPQKAKPEISEPTKKLVKEWNYFESHRKQAAEETKKFIEWTIQEASTMIQKELNWDDPIEKWIFNGSVFLLRKKTWIIDQTEFGVSYSSEKMLGNHLINEYNHLIGIRINSLDEMDSKSRIEIADRIRSTIAKEEIVEKLKMLVPKNLEKQLRGKNQWWAISRYVHFDRGREWNDWSKELQENMLEFTRLVENCLDKVAMRN